MSTTKIDRTTTTPFLLKLFYRTGSFHRTDEFQIDRPSLPPYAQIYTWHDCTLEELTKTITTALPSLLPSPSIGTRLIFRLIFPDAHDQVRPGQAGRFKVKELGSVVVGAGGPGVTLDGDDPKALEKLEGDAQKTLQEARFVIGDYVTVAIFPPLPNGDVADGKPRGVPPRQEYGRPIGGPLRENGYGGYGGGRRGGRFGDGPRGGVPPGEWRRGDIPPGNGGYGRGRGRGGRAY